MRNPLAGSVRMLLVGLLVVGCSEQPPVPTETTLSQGGPQ